VLHARHVVVSDEASLHSGSGKTRLKSQNGPALQFPGGRGAAETPTAAAAALQQPSIQTRTISINEAYPCTSGVRRMTLRKYNHGMGMGAFYLPLLLQHQRAEATATSFRQHT
jgi:hypothetical protein